MERRWKDTVSYSYLGNLTFAYKTNIISLEREFLMFYSQLSLLENQELIESSSEVPVLAKALHEALGRPNPGTDLWYAPVRGGPCSIRTFWRRHEIGFELIKDPIHSKYVQGIAISLIDYLPDARFEDSDICRHPRWQIRKAIFKGTTPVAIATAICV